MEKGSIAVWSDLLCMGPCHGPPGHARALDLTDPLPLGGSGPINVNHRPARWDIYSYIYTTTVVARNFSFADKGDECNRTVISNLHNKISKIRSGIIESSPHISSIWQMLHNI